MARTAGSAADDTRQRILDIAVDLFIEQGYAGTSVRDISERLGMTKGSLYYHFASKEEVLNALVAPLLEDLDQFVLDAGAAGKIDRDLLERLVNLLAALQRSLADSSDPLAALRGRCALGVINAGAIAPRFDTVAPDGSYARERAVRTRLTEQEKRLVVDAAMAVLSVPA